MSQQVLDRLMEPVSDLAAELRNSIHQHVQEGQPREALGLLQGRFQSAAVSTPLQVLQVYLLHMAGDYTQANRVMDGLIGLDISQQLVMDNCPDEDALMASWDSQAEGVSVLCTTFNHARFIDMALASFFSQVTTHPFEVIVRDDASTDGTGEILAKWAKRYPRLLKVICLAENTYQKGQSPMLATMPLATYPLMAMCEGDDFWIDSEKIQKQAQLLQKNPTWSAITHNHFELEESTGRLMPGRAMKSRGFLPRQDLINVNMVLWGHTLMVRRTLLKMPEYQLQDGVLGDQVMTCMLGAAGQVFFLGDLFGSVARRNLFSTYTPLSSNDKQRRRINTRRFLAPVLAQRGEKQASQRMLSWCQVAEQQLLSLAA